MSMAIMTEPRQVLLWARSGERACIRISADETLVFRVRYASAGMEDVADHVRHVLQMALEREAKA